MINNWISSAGGPLVLMEKEKATFWGGCFSSKYEDFESDYEYACSVEDDIEILNFRDSNIIILGDDPNQTSFCSLDDSLGIMLIRWVYAANEKSVISHISNLQKLGADSFGAPKIDIFHIASENLILFDSACPGDDIHFNNSDSLEIFLEIGSYQVSSYFYKPDEQTFLLLHKISQLKCS